MAGGRSCVRLAIGLFLLLVLCSQQAESWSGKTVNYRVCVPYRVRVCAYSTWWGCCGYRWVWRERYEWRTRCQNGWKVRPGTQDCSVPICSRSCQNGGTCRAPNTCSCTQGFTGSTCEGTLACDVFHPCYPGACSSSTCSCTPGFSPGGRSDDETCRTLGNSQMAEIFTCRSTIKNVMRTNDREKYSYIVESANPNETTVDVLWSNYQMFNYIQMEGLGIYDPVLPARPEYVRDSELGVVGAVVDVTHTKISRTGGIETPYRDTLTCALTEETDCRIVNSLKVCSVWPCTAMNNSYTVQFETGDNLTMTLRFYAGGIRNVQQVGYQEFRKVNREKTLFFRFDSSVPQHPCMDFTHNCSLNDKPLDVSPAFTKDPISMRWGGWSDDVSGMFRYVWEVFRLSPNGDGVLQETSPLSPVNNITLSVVNHSSGMLSASYTPPEPGMYSVVLQAADRANNSVYVRQFVLFDDDSAVTVDSTFPMSVAQAVDMGWVRDSSLALDLTWTRHFLNKFHEDNQVHGPIFPYPRQFDDAVRDGTGAPKFIWDEVNIGPGKTKTYVREEVPNARGIRRFFVQETGNVSSPAELSWIEVFLNETFQFPSRGRSDGDIRRLWVRAEDWVGNTEDDFVLVRFDSTPPVVIPGITEERNINSSEHEFASRITLAAQDTDSAVTTYRLQFTRSDNGEKVYNDTTWKNPMLAECTEGCDCLLGKKECFRHNVTIDLNNCWLQVDRTVINTVAVDVTAFPINAAGVEGNGARRRFNDLTSLLGILNYAGPTDVGVSLLTSESVRLNWTNKPTCLEVSEWWVKYYIDGKETKYFVDKRESVFMLPGLSPSTTYDIFIITGYNGIMSDPERVTITTLARSGLTAGQVAGIAVGSVSLLIVILLIIVAILYMNGILFILLRRPVPQNRYRPSFMKRREKRSTGGVDGDVYIYGGDSAVPVGKQISEERLTLIEVVSEGRFARIYKASLSTDGKSEIVAAKMLKEDRLTEEDLELMRTKMAFMTREVPSHPNVLQCLGGIMESPWGPVMVLEYCEHDTLLTWLTKQRRNVTDDVVERLYHMAHGVVKGMECLASAGIVHKRLAARNVLLTFTLEVKVAGFGPTHLPGEEDKVKERLPVRWLPPECANSLRDAEESTDVWSFGVTLWEIFSLGDKPYSNIDAHRIALEIKRGTRLRKPEYCDEQNYAMMQRCWAEKPGKRPTFKQLAREYQNTMSGDPRLSTYNYGNPTYQP